MATFKIWTDANKTWRDAGTIESVIRMAKSDVYMTSREESEGREALAAGKNFSYAYGFAEVHIQQEAA